MERRIPTVKRFPKKSTVTNDTVDIAIRASNVTNFSAFMFRDTKENIDVAITQDIDNTDRLHFHELAEKAMRYIHPDHRDIVKAKFLDGLTLTETAKAFGISKQRVHQIITKELRHVRERLEKIGISEENVF